MFRLFILASLLAPCLLHAQQYSHGDPTAEEQLMLEMINRARMDPKAEGTRLMDTPDQQVQQAYTYWQIDKAKTKSAFSTYPSRPPLAFHPKLIQAARLHTADMVANNFQGHVGSNGSQLNQRYANQGYTSMGQYGENVAAYATSVWYGHCGFNVDWGPQNQIDLGHRSNIMNFSGAVYTECGIGIQHTSGGLQSGTVGPMVITQDFGIQSTRYITGVVYEDKNANGFYDVGEGLEGVKIQPSRGSYWAVSSASGGYAIPFSGNGAVTLTASGGALGETMTVQATFSGDNLKVDFVPAAQVPGLVLLSSPANNATNISPSTVNFTWQSAAFAESYYIQIATANTFAASAIVLEQTVSSTTASASNLACGTQYFWRVRAANTLGNGTWSNVYSFTTSGTMPGRPSTISPKGAATFDNMGTITCSWSAATGADRYHVRFSSNANFSELFAQDSTIQGTTFNLPTSQLPAGITAFYWSVRAGSDCGWGTWSGFALVNPTITSVDGDISLRWAVSVVPMPATSDAHIVRMGLVGGFATLSLYEVGGNVIGTCKVDLQNTDSLPLRAITGTNIVPGFYVLEAALENGQAIRTPLVVR